MEFVKALDINELPMGQMKIVTLQGKTIVLINDNGAYYALNNKCPHLGGSLGNGELKGTMITCPRHGSSYDVITGKNIGYAKLGFVKIPVKDAETYPVKIDGNDILIGLP
jgi:3-phenylpropionate/trans-cinnamate dioxygenase ferredoxin component